MEKYGVVMHVYNEAQYLRHVFDAINRQTVPPQCIYIIDDGSTDETLSIIQEYRYHYKTIKQDTALPAYARRANAFNKAIELLKIREHVNLALVLKVDGDTLIKDSYAETLLGEFMADPRLAACSGVSTTKTKTRDLNNGAVMYRLSVLPKAKPVYGWDRQLQLALVRRGYNYRVSLRTGYSDLRPPTVTAPSLGRVLRNRVASVTARMFRLENVILMMVLGWWVLGILYIVFVVGVPV